MIYIVYIKDIRKILSFLISIMLKKKTFLQYLFWTFDVYKKENLLEENIKRFWQWNFILLKRHYYYLVKSVFTMFLSLLCFVWLIMMTYNQYSQHLEMFFILTSVLCYIHIAMGMSKYMVYDLCNKTFKSSL